MSRQHRSHSLEFKRQVVQEYLAGDAVALDVAQIRTRGRHPLVADWDQARLHHRAPRAHSAEPIAAGEKASHAGATADPAAIEPPAFDQPFLGRADRRADHATEIAARAVADARASSTRAGCAPGLLWHW